MACFLACARADTVTLDNGQTLEGRVTDDGKVVTVELAQGIVKIPKARVKSITPKSTPLDDYAQRAADIRATAKRTQMDPAAEAQLWFELAQWAEQQRLPMARAEALRAAIDRFPEHVAARLASGFVLHEGRWVTRSERYQALGMVKHEGQWVPPEAVEDARRAKRERQ